MDKIFLALAWPIIVLIIALAVLWLFKPQIAALISRTKKLGAGGLEAYEIQPQPVSEEKKGIEEFLKSFDNPLVSKAEQLILQDLNSRHIGKPNDREKALVRALATANIIRHFEQVYGVLWASQLACLHYLNPRSNGVETSELLPLYENARVTYPAWYQGYPFDKWLGFIINEKLVTQTNSRYFITDYGREFLKYLIAAAKPGPYYG